MKKVLSFRPLTGNYISQCIPLSCTTSQVCFRPLTGNYISQYDIGGKYSDEDLVSVPLRGITFLNTLVTYYYHG